QQFVERGDVVGERPDAGRLGIARKGHAAAGHRARFQGGGQLVDPAGEGRQSASVNRKRSPWAAATARLRAAAGLNRSAVSRKRTAEARGTRPGASRPTTSTSIPGPGAPCSARAASVRSTRGESRFGIRMLRVGRKIFYVPLRGSARSRIVFLQC